MFNRSLQSINMIKETYSPLLRAKPGLGLDQIRLRHGRLGAARARHGRCLLRTQPGLRSGKAGQEGRLIRAGTLPACSLAFKAFNTGLEKGCLQMFRLHITVALILASMAPAQALADPAPSSVLEGTASVIDGDTIEIHETRIRLDGIDAPERGSLCGRTNVYQKAALALSDFISNRTVSCDISGKDRYGRSIGQCRAGGDDLAAFAVSHGWARDWPRYSKGRYAGQEREARNDKAGLWGLDCPDGLWGNRSYD